MIEKEPYIFQKIFSGNWEKFKDAFSNPETKIFFDEDGILADTPKVVLKKFEKRTGITADPSKIDSWDYLTRLAREANLSQYAIEHAEDDWYRAESLSRATRYLYMRPVTRKTVSLFGNENNFVLTSREPFLGKSTIRWNQTQYPEIPRENILIRKTDKIKPTEFKVEQMAIRASKNSWVILVEDSTKYVKAVLQADIKNLLVIHIPLGVIKPDFEDDRLILIRRYPGILQAMYPLMDAIEKAVTKE